MATPNPHESLSPATTLRYRIVLEEALGPVHRPWFEDVQIVPNTNATMLEVDVPDQAALHGLLRRIHDLHLRLVNVERIESNHTQTP